MIDTISLKIVLGESLWNLLKELNVSQKLWVQLNVKAVSKT